MGSTSADGESSVVLILGAEGSNKVLTPPRGYLNWTNLQDVIDLYAQAEIQLEGVMSDLDYLYLNRIFSHNANYGVDEGREFLARLHANGQYWLPILDPNVSGSCD